MEESYKKGFFSGIVPYHRYRAELRDLGRARRRRLMHHGPRRKTPRFFLRWMYLLTKTPRRKRSPTLDTLILFTAKSGRRSFMAAMKPELGFNIRIFYDTSAAWLIGRMAWSIKP